MCINVTRHMLDNPSDIASLIVVIIGSIAVISSYIIVFGNEEDGYTTSRFWVGIPASTATSIIPLQLIAAIGFFMFTVYALGIVAPSPTVGILSYQNGYVTTVLYAMFFIASTIWPFATLSYLNEKKATSPSAVHLLGVVCPLLIAAISSILFTAGAFEADMHPVAVVGILLFSNVVVLADGVGWNAKLIWSHAHASDEFINATNIAL